MTHIQLSDNRAKSLTKGEKINMPVTIIDCPPMSVIGVVFYKLSARGMRKSDSVLAEKMSKEISKKIQLPKKKMKKLEEITEFDDLRLLVHSQPKMTSTGTKKPKVIELALGGNKEDKLAYAKEVSQAMLGVIPRRTLLMKKTHILILLIPAMALAFSGCSGGTWFPKSPAKTSKQGHLNRDRDKYNAPDGKATWLVENERAACIRRKR